MVAFLFLLLFLPHPSSASSSCSSSSSRPSSSSSAFPLLVLKLIQNIGMTGVPCSLFHCMLLHFPDQGNSPGHSLGMGWWAYAKRHKSVVSCARQVASPDALSVDIAMPLARPQKVRLTQKKSMALPFG